MLVRALITQSWYLSGLVGRQFETVDGSEITDGLEILNQFLDEQSATGKSIPYYTRLSVPPVVGQEAYIVPNCILVDSITYTIDTVRYRMQRKSRFEFFGIGRVNNINSLPVSYYVERTLGGSTFYVYFTPTSDIDAFEVDGRFSLGNVTLDLELNTRIDSFYVQYLKYSLARRLCDWFNVGFADQKDATRKRLEQAIEDVNYQDFTRTNINPLSRQVYFSYVQANLGKGWTTS